MDDKSKEITNEKWDGMDDNDITNLYLTLTDEILSKYDRK